MFGATYSLPIWGTFYNSVFGSTYIPDFATPAIMPMWKAWNGKYSKMAPSPSPSPSPRSRALEDRRPADDQAHPQPTPTPSTRQADEPAPPSPPETTTEGRRPGADPSRGGATRRPLSGLPRPLVDHAHGLALASVDRTRLLELHGDLDVEHVVDRRSARCAGSARARPWSRRRRPRRPRSRPRSCRGSPCGRPRSGSAARSAGSLISTSSIWLGKTLTPRMMSMSSLRPIGLVMRARVRPQAQGS